MKREYLFGIALFVMTVLGFLGGMQFQKSLKPTGPVTTTSSTDQAASGGRFGGFGGSRPTFGTVASISGTSMTVTTQSGSTVTVSLSGNPTVTNNGSAGSLSDIQTGDTVAVVGTTTNGTVTATRVLLNPSFGGGGAPGGGTPATPSNGT